MSVSVSLIFSDRAFNIQSAHQLLKDDENDAFYRKSAIPQNVTNDDFSALTLTLNIVTEKSSRHIAEC